MNNFKINENERIDDLQLDGLRLIQNPDWFCFGVDAVLLSDFALKSIKKNNSVLDLCCGNGIVPILLSAKSPAAHITGIEIQPPVADLAARSVKMNGLDEKIDIVCGDLREAVKIFGKCSFDTISCNPPYKEAHGGLKNSDDIVTAARHEIFCTLRDVIEVSEQLLKPYGKLVLIHRPERLADILCIMREMRTEPKRIRFVHPSCGKTATMILVEGAKHGNPKLFLEPPLYIHDENGNYTEEINRIYGRI